MMGIVEEFEKTISQLISEKERESVCNVIERERSGRYKYETKKCFILKNISAGYKLREHKSLRICKL